MMLRYRPQMNAILAASGLSFPVRIIPFETGWLVAFRHGRYASPLEKSEAVEKAAQLALEIGTTEIAVCDVLGNVTETLDVIQRAKKPD